MSKEKTKDPAAVALGKKRWKNVDEQQRSDAMREAVNTRWENATEEERKALGQKLAKARAAARKKKTK